jgi:hypothetical protein
MRVEVFSGARAVDATEASRAWARSIVREVLASLPPDALIVCGDAIGLDRAVRMEVDEVLASSPNQVLFFREKPLAADVEPVELY